MLQSGHKHWDIYQQAVLLTKELYRITESFPDTERAVLTYSLRRLAVSLCQNLATGFISGGKKQARIFKICVADCVAIDTQLELAQAVNLIAIETVKPAAQLLNEIYKKLTESFKEE